MNFPPLAVWTDYGPLGAAAAPIICFVFLCIIIYKLDPRYVRREKHEDDVKRLEASDTEIKTWIKETASTIERHENTAQKTLDDLKLEQNRHFMSFSQTLGRLEGQFLALFGMGPRPPTPPAQS
jgi:hypothetical protein